MPFPNGKKRGVFSPLYGRIAPRFVLLNQYKFRGIRLSYFPKSGAAKRKDFPAPASSSPYSCHIRTNQLLKSTLLLSCPKPIPPSLSISRSIKIIQPYPFHSTTPLPPITKICPTDHLSAGHIETILFPLYFTIAVFQHCFLLFKE